MEIVQQDLEFAVHSRKYRYIVKAKHARVLLYWEREYLQANRLLIQFLIRYSYNITKSSIHTKTAKLIKS